MVNEEVQKNLPNNAIIKNIIEHVGCYIVTYEMYNGVFTKTIIKDLPSNSQLGPSILLE